MNKPSFLCHQGGKPQEPAFVTIYPWIHTTITFNTTQIRHICDNASMTAVVLYSRLVGYLPLGEGQSKVPTGGQGGDNRNNQLVVRR